MDHFLAMLKLLRLGILELYKQIKNRKKKKGKNKESI